MKFVPNTLLLNYTLITWLLNPVQAEEIRIVDTEPFDPFTAIFDGFGWLLLLNLLAGLISHYAFEIPFTNVYNWILMSQLFLLGEYRSRKLNAYLKEQYITDYNVSTMGKLLIDWYSFLNDKLYNMFLLILFVFSINVYLLYKLVTFEETKQD